MKGNEQPFVVFVAVVNFVIQIADSKGGCGNGSRDLKQPKRLSESPLAPVDLPGDEEWLAPHGIECDRPPEHVKCFFASLGEEKLTRELDAHFGVQRRNQLRAELGKNLAIMDD